MAVAVTLANLAMSVVQEELGLILAGGLSVGPSAQLPSAYGVRMKLSDCLLVLPPTHLL